MGLGDETFSRSDMCDDAVHDFCVLSGVLRNHPASCPVGKGGRTRPPPAPLNRPLALAEPGPYLRAAILWNVEFATS